MHRPTKILPHSALGFRVWSVKPHGGMKEAHTHPDVEFNFLRTGQVTYLHGGSHQTVTAGRLAVFWGGVPHQTLAPGIAGSGIWLTVPLAWVMQWRLPNAFTQRLLEGELVQVDADTATLERWLADYASRDAGLHRALQLELEALLVRLALKSPPRSVPRPSSQGASRIEQVVGEIAARYRDSVTVDDIAAAVKLHPKYLMQIFKRHCRMSIWEYLTRLRVSHAQRLLVTTDARVAEIALESGFGSTAAFYQAFASRTNGMKPLDYRRRHASDAGGASP